MRVSFHIYQSSGVPIYRQLMEQITIQIGSGLLKPGMFLPTIRQVAQDLKINFLTVSKAYSLLRRDGVVEHLRGQGMVVRPMKSIGSLKDRLEILKPLAKELAAKASQLSLSKKQTLQFLKLMMDEVKKRP